MAGRPMRALIGHLRRLTAPPGGGRDDGRLLEQFLAEGDESAFAELVRRHGPMVLGVCRRLLGDAHDAEDAFQATFLVLASKADSVRPREMVGNWLYGVAYHTALKARAVNARRRARERQVATMPEPEAPPPTPDGLPAGLAAGSDLRSLLDQELERLPEKYRAAVVLCDLEGRSRREAARLLGWKEGTLSGRLARARAVLAERLGRRGVTLSAGALALALARESAACVPAALAQSTARAAVLVAAGQAAAGGVVSGQVAALADGVIRSMVMSKLKVVTSVLLAVSVVGVGVGSSGRAVLAEAPPADQPVSEAADSGAAKPAGNDSVWLDPSVPFNVLTLNEIVSLYGVPPSGTSSATVKEVDPARRTITVRQTQWVRSLAISPDGRYLHENLLFNQIYNPALLNLGSGVPGGGALLLFPNTNLIPQVKEMKHKLAPDAEIVIDGRKGRLEELTADVQVQLTVADGLVTKLVATGATVEDRVVRSVDFTRNSILVGTRDGQGEPRQWTEYALRPGAKVTLEGREVSLDELRGGMRVRLQLSAVKPSEVVGVAARGPSIRATLRAIDAAGRTLNATLSRVDLLVKGLRVAEAAEVTIGGKPARFSDLRPGMRVTLRMAAEADTDTVVGIDVRKNDP